jgi:hypothetical protein
MPLKLKLETERGERVEEVFFGPGHWLEDLLPGDSDIAYQCWRFIDRYGHTVFNRLQMRQFLAELPQVRQQHEHPQHQAILDEVERLALRCQATYHHYLKFYGD